MCRLSDSACRGFCFFLFLRSWEATSCGHSIQSIRALGNVVAMT